MRKITFLIICLGSITSYGQETVIPAKEKTLSELEKSVIQLEKSVSELEKEKIENQKKEQILSENSVKYYRAHILNTNFAIPFARFNFRKKNPDSEVITGDLILFNSIGAGFGYSWGEMRVVKNNGEIVDQDFSNIFGLNLGVLFSAGTGDDAKNVFAPVINLGILDFQLGFGYELGTVDDDHNRPFVTLSYSIPLYKLKRTGLWIMKKTELEEPDSGDKSRLGI